MHVFYPFFIKMGVIFFAHGSPKDGGLDTFLKKRGKGCPPLPLFFKNVSKPPSLGDPWAPFCDRWEKGSPKGWVKLELCSSLTQPFGDPFSHLAQKGRIWRSQIRLGPPLGVQARAVLELGPPKGVQALELGSSPEEPKATRDEIHEKTFSSLLEKVFHESQTRGQLFFYVFFLKILMDIWSYFCV